MYRVTIDTGGTFTDAVAVDDEGVVTTAKVPTTPSDLAVGILHCLTALAETTNGKGLDCLLGQTSILIIGSTVATNILIQAKGCKVGMITTQGFRDVLEMPRIPKTNIYDVKRPKPLLLIPRYLRKSVAERMDFSGRVITPLDETGVKEAARELVQEHGVEAICVFYLHSYANTEHERRTAALINQEFPQVRVVLSSEVPRIIEFDRCNTAVVSAYVSSGVANLLLRLERTLSEAGLKGQALVLTNNAGAQTVEMCLKCPAGLVGSGPAAGPLAARYIGELTGIENIIEIDVGGTSVDLSLVPHGRILTAPDGKVLCDQRIAINMIDVDSIALGGGSVAWLDFGNILQVGPESAGAEPGPACYGKGGQNPTVTDANIVLGYIPADYFLGGQTHLDVELAKRAIEEKIARPLGLNLVEAASAINSLTNAKLADGIRLHCTKLGYDPSGWTLCAGGGGGPVHAIEVARDLHIASVLIPKTAPVFCALGMSTCDIRHDFVHTYYQGEEPIDECRVSQMYDDMITEGKERLTAEGVPQERQVLARGADIRYYGQIHEVEAWMPGDSGKLDLGGLIKDFHNRHNELFGYSDPAFPTQLINLKVSAFGKLPSQPKLKEMPVGGKNPEHARKRDREVYFKESGGFNTTRCYDGDRLTPGNIVEGPAVIEESATTIVVPGRSIVEVDRYGNYIGKP